MVQNRKLSKKPVIENRQAKFNYELGENFEAGLSLLGWEVKSIRASRVDIKDGYIIMKKGEACLIGMSISPLKEVTHEVDPMRTRKLLLTKPELSKIFKGTQEKGLTCLPIKIFWKDNLIKLKISLGKGKSKFDKRESIKQKEWKKEKAKNLKLNSNFS
jgi:SsrA-binding protein